MNPDIHREVMSRLDAYGFKQQGEWLRKGVCPVCGEKELYTHADHPWVLRCGRLNHCGAEFFVKDLFPDIFNHWSKRTEHEQARNPKAAADAYLAQARGFDLSRIAGLYTQETYFDRARNIGSATVRFPVGETYWERLIDDPARFGKQKARFKPGASYKGQWWVAPEVDLATAPELWLVEGIFDAIALMHVGRPAVALLSCNNYPAQALDALRAGRTDKLPRLVWALDGDKAGRDFTRKHVKRAREDGWTCRAALIPQNGKSKRDWNDLYVLDRHAGESAKKYLDDAGFKTYLYHGAILLAQSADEKALLMYEHNPNRNAFDFDFNNRLYWFELDLNAYQRTMDRISEDPDAPKDIAALRQLALKESKAVQEIANCYPQPLYFQQNKLTDEHWYYFRVSFPTGRAPIKDTFTSAQVASATEFNKRLLGVAPGGMFDGTNRQLKRMLRRPFQDIKQVETLNFVGYSKEHGCYVFGDVGVKDGEIYRLNDEDFFDIGKLSIKSLNRSAMLTINADASGYKSQWFDLLWTAYGAKGIVALAFWFGALFAEQIRALDKSFPFLEIVGEAGSGKSTLIEFLWKLVGRLDYEGIDPCRATPAARARIFSQVAGLPVVLIESDRERTDNGNASVKNFDWDELKSLYNGRGIRARGVANGGNETLEPSFRGAIVISQNNDVQASEAILSRIVHVNIDRAGHNAQTREAALALERMPIEEVSGFVLAATKREMTILERIAAQIPVHQQTLRNRARSNSDRERIVKNHAQLMAMVDALRLVVPRMSDAQHQAAFALIADMVQERNQTINADHPLVQEFWDMFAYLNGDGFLPVLDHSCNDEVIAINLQHFIEEAANHRQQVPPLRELKKVLRTSRRHKFIAAKPVRSRIKATNDNPGSVHCWVFARADK